MKFKFIISLFIILILSACELSEQDIAATQNAVASETKAAQPILTLSNTPEPISTETFMPAPTTTLYPTSTVTPSPTSSSTATETPLPTPTSIPIAVVDVSLANIYSGIATYAPVVAIFVKDTALKIIGITPDESWLLVEIAPEQNGWVPKKAVHLENQVPIPTIVPPPPPTLIPTAAKSPSVSVQVSKDSFILEFFNFQSGEHIDYSIYKNGVRVGGHGVSCGSSGYAKRDLSWMKLSKNANYRIVVIGNQGSYAEKSFTP